MPIPNKLTNSPWCWLVFFCLSLILGFALYHYPLQPLALTWFLLLYAIGLIYYKPLWLFALPGLLPVMDFTPWSGRFFFDEFDLVVLTTLAVKVVTYKTASGIRHCFNKFTVLLFFLFVVCYGISLMRGLLPLQALDANAFSNYYSHYNALRVGKGALWGLCLLPFVTQALQENPSSRLFWMYGMLLGLLGVVGIAIIERLLFVGLFDFSTHYRINAAFSSMHTGGGHIESYLMLALPNIAILFFGQKGFSRKFFGIMLFFSSFYVLMVTFSRGGYIGFIVEILVFIISGGVHLQQKQKAVLQWQQIMAAIIGLSVLLAMAIPVFQGGLIAQRFKIFSQDKAIRTYHWLDAKSMMEDTVLTTFFGMGLGSYPRTYFWQNTEGVVPGTYKIETGQDGNPYLVLRSGDALFMGQFVKVQPNTGYHIQMDVQSQVKTSLSISLCEKSMLYSLRCAVTAVPIVAQEANNPGWQHISTVINTTQVAAPIDQFANNILARPVQFALYHGNGIGVAIEVDNVQLITPDGNNLLVNGGFTNATDHWYFTAEKHHPWHILNIWMQVLFEQGFLGLCLFLLFIGNSIYTLLKKLAQDHYATIYLSALTGFLVVGWVDSPFDAPRLSLLFFLLLTMASARPPQQQCIEAPKQKLAKLKYTK